MLSFSSHNMKMVNFHFLYSDCWDTSILCLYLVSQGINLELYENRDKPVRLTEVCILGFISKRLLINTVHSSLTPAHTFPSCDFSGAICSTWNVLSSASQPFASSMFPHHLCIPLRHHALQIIPDRTV